MESNYYSLKREDNQLIVVTHLAQLLTYLTGFGGLIVPLIIWVTQKDRIEYMDANGKAILNFQISLIVYAIVSIPLILFFGLGLLMLILVLIMGFLMPIINAVRVGRGEAPHYPFSINFLN